MGLAQCLKCTVKQKNFRQIKFSRVYLNNNNNKNPFHEFEATQKRRFGERAPALTNMLSIYT